jgi:hypothetical protein
MRKRGKILTLGIALLLALVAIPTLAQNSPVEQARNTNKTEPLSLDSFSCRTFITPGHPHSLRACVSQHGNMHVWESPIGSDHMSSEGYAVCYNFPGGGFRSAWDKGGAESGWGPPSIVQPGGKNTFPLTITRTSTDGALRLKQIFTFNTELKEMFIEMQLTNISGKNLNLQHITRYFDGDIVPGSGDDTYDRTQLSVLSRDYTGSTRGTMLSALTDTALTTQVQFWSGWAPELCVGGSQPIPTPPGDYIGRVAIGGYVMVPGRMESVKFAYRVF